MVARTWASFQAGAARTVQTLRIWRVVARIKFGRFVVRPMARLFASIRAGLVRTLLAATERLQLTAERARERRVAGTWHAHSRFTKSIVLRIKYHWPIPSDITAACGSALALMASVVGFSVIRSTTTMPRAPQIAVRRPALAIPGPIPIGLRLLLVPPPSENRHRPIALSPATFTASLTPVALPILPTARPMGSMGHFLGTLAVESDPVGAVVYVNQERVGFTPLVLQDLRAGSHAVWIESEGYRRWSAGVLVPADKRTRIVVTLLPTGSR